MNDELAKRLRDSVAEFYEKHGAAFSRTRGLVWPEEKFVAELIAPGMTVADIGAGNGRFARLLPPDTTYLAVEPSSELRSHILKNIQVNNLKNVRIIDGQLFDLPLEDDTADVTVCFAVFHHLPTPEGRRTAFNELIRITKPGGLIAATAWHLDPQDPRLTPLADGDPGDYWMDWKAEGADAKRYVHLFTENEWNELWTDPRLTVERLGLFGREGWTEDAKAARNWMAICRKV